MQIEMSGKTNVDKLLHFKMESLHCDLPPTACYVNKRYRLLSKMYRTQIPILSNQK